MNVLLVSMTSELFKKFDYTLLKSVILGMGVKVGNNITAVRLVKKAISANDLTFWF